MVKVKSLRLVATIILGGIAIGAIPVLKNIAEEKNAKLVLKEDLTELKRKENGSLPTSYAPIIKRASGAVVKVHSSKIVNTQRRGRSPFNDPLFRDFFGERMPRMEQPQQRQQGLGSGVIISPDGYILTNNHVVTGADEVKITRPDDKKEYVAKVIGTDPKTDIALLKIDATNLSAVTIADSDKARVGDIVFAIGNPFGIGTTVTKGIISAKGRDIGLVDYEGFLQTDAAINPGNSGGALIDATGRLLGINTAILSRSGGSQGIGFAIPINMATRIAKSLIENGSVSRGFLGVNIQDITPELKEEFQLDNLKGALVTRVSKDSSAAAAGIETGDVIVSFDGKSVKDVQALRFSVAATIPGKEIDVTVIRDGKRRTLKATLKSMDGELVAGKDGTQNIGLLKGVTITALTAENRRMHNIPADIDGVLVERLEVGSVAERSGLKIGDVIESANRKRVANLNDLSKALSKGDKKRVLLRIWRQGGTLFLVLK